MVTYGSARSRSTRAARASVSVIRTGSGNRALGAGHRACLHGRPWDRRPGAARPGTSRRAAALGPEGFQRRALAGSGASPWPSAGWLGAQSRRNRPHARLPDPRPAPPSAPTDAGQTVRLSGWVHAKRDHGGLLFIDLRDHDGITQIVFPAGSPLLDAVDAVRVESVLTVTGAVVLRDGPTVNPRCPPARSRSAPRRWRCSRRRRSCRCRWPGTRPYGDELRLRYRYLDLRRERVHRNMMLRARRDRLPAPAHDRAGLHRVPDADPDRVQPGGRPRLPGAGAAASGQVLRAAAGAAAVQAAADGGGLRPLLPDRALLPRRGRARRPLARASSTSSTSR